MKSSAFSGWSWKNKIKYFVDDRRKKVKTGNCYLQMSLVDWNGRLGNAVLLGNKTDVHRPDFGEHAE